MSEYEVLDLLSTHRSEGGFHVMNFAAAMFGYVAAAYFVGAKLSRFQTYAVTFLFCLFVPGPMSAAYDAASAIAYLAEHYGPLYESVRSSARTTGVFAVTVIPATILSGWLVSILFMWQVRRRR